MGRTRDHGLAYIETHRSSERCELCGSSRGLEVHHIVPISLGGPDERDNMILLCQRCHGMLTPKSILTRLGIKRTKERNMLCAFAVEFLEEVDRQAEDTHTANDILDIFNEKLRKYTRKSDCCGADMRKDGEGWLNG